MGLPESVYDASGLAVRFLILNPSGKQVDLPTAPHILTGDDAPTSSAYPAGTLYLRRNGEIYSYSLMRKSPTGPYAIGYVTLQEGQSVTQTYTVRVTDNAGATADESVTITINGTVANNPTTFLLGGSTSGGSAVITHPASRISVNVVVHIPHLAKENPHNTSQQ